MSVNIPPLNDKPYPLLPDRMYTQIKWFVQLVIPAVMTLYSTLAALWAWPNPVAVLGTMSAVGLFFGTVLGISTYTYYNSDARLDGIMRVNKTDAGQLYDLELKDDPIALTTKDEIVFKVDRSH